jgi:catechol 2,3-dioxygenase-like lactoylglutathione lyase family enzyme
MNTQFVDPFINYFVEDVEAVVRFYTEQFGFVETFRTPKQGAPEHVEVRLGALTLGLSSREAGRRVHGLQLAPTGGPRAELVLRTDHVDEVYARLIEKGVPNVCAPHNFLGSLRSARVMDPEGNLVEIVSGQAALC